MFDDRTKKSILQADKLIVLNKNARDIFARDTEFLVIEGGINPNEFAPVDSKAGPREEKNIVYGGSLAQYSGIQQLADCMDLIRDEKVVLDIYGDGTLREYLENHPSNRVGYHGKVSNEEMLKIQQNAWLLVNPRPVDDAIANVTFPSKIFEYLMSGVPVLSTRLSGFLPEYEGKLFFAENNSTEELAKRIDEIAGLDEKTLAETAQRAKDFLLQEKTWDKQTEKMVDFIMQ